VDDRTTSTCTSHALNVRAHSSWPHSDRCEYRPHPLLFVCTAPLKVCESPQRAEHACGLPGAVRGLGQLPSHVPLGAVPWKKGVIEGSTSATMMINRARVQRASSRHPDNNAAAGHHLAISINIILTKRLQLSNFWTSKTLQASSERAILAVRDKKNQPRDDYTEAALLMLLCVLYCVS
jgi:hypothetical protein